ncbi:MAG: transglutaminase-like domain-containing protein [Candidatus Omnitrophota bacterium]|nr:transglutaminase-like domain-containing protein [Candidatus Omnitrophota bacterium]
MKKIILIALVLVHLLSVSCFAGDGSLNIPSYVKSPEDVARWFSHDFKYQLMIPKTPQTPEEMLSSKGGDCDDFAALASEALKRMGISSSVVAIMLNDWEFAHAVCIWKEKDGTYSFISNQEIRRTGENTMDGAIKKFYPAAKKILVNFDRLQQRKYIS